MASKRAVVPAKHLFNGFKAYQEPVQHARPWFARSMATEVSQPNATLSQSYIDAHLDSTSPEPILQDKLDLSPPVPSSRTLAPTTQPYQAPANPFLTNAQCTLYKFPSMEPTSFTYYPSTHLLLPLRRDILHRAVIYEGDAERKGTASTKWRADVHGSGRKVRPQKGTGKARLGDKKSPMLRGGGVAFGPKPRDFSTELPRKVYDLALRTALSYRYRQGELIVTDSDIEILGIHKDSRERYLRDMLSWNKMGKGHGRTLFITEKRRPSLYKALEGDKMDREAHASEFDNVDVKNLLEGPRLVIERAALDQLLMKHESDVSPRQKLEIWQESGLGSLEL